MTGLAWIIAPYLVPATVLTLISLAGLIPRRQVAYLGDWDPPMRRRP